MLRPLEFNSQASLHLAACNSLTIVKCPSGICSGVRMSLTITRFLGRQDSPWHMAEQTQSWVTGLCQGTQLDKVGDLVEEVKS